MPVATLDALILTNNGKSVVTGCPCCVCIPYPAAYTLLGTPAAHPQSCLWLVYLSRDPSALSCHHLLGEVLPQLWQACTIKNKEPIRTKFDV